MMQALDIIRAAIRYCGCEVELTVNSQTFRFAACIQPLSYNLQTDSRPLTSRFGQEDTRQFVYYGPVDGGGEFAEEGSLIHANQQVFVLSPCHDFCFQGKPVFRRALAKKVRGGNSNESVFNIQTETG